MFEKGVRDFQKIIKNNQIEEKACGSRLFFWGNLAPGVFAKVLYAGLLNGIFRDGLKPGVRYHD